MLLVSLFEDAADLEYRPAPGPLSGTAVCELLDSLIAGGAVLDRWA